MSIPRHPALVDSAALEPLADFLDQLIEERSQSRCACLDESKGCALDALAPAGKSEVTKFSKAVKFERRLTEHSSPEV